MKFIEEIVVEEFLPTFRSELAAELRDRGLTQSEVATALGISQSAVSKYAHGEVNTNEQISGDERFQELIDRLGEGLATDEMSRVQALVEAEVFIRQLERADLLAGLHEEAFPPLSGYEETFDIHDAEGGIRESERVLASVRRGVRGLERTSGFTGMIPAVGSNLVESLSDAETIDDVAAIPGRILDVKGKTTVPGDPEFGVSEHVAGVLLAARDAGSDARAALNVRYDEDLLSELSERGHVAVEFDPRRSVAEAIEDALQTNPEADVLYQTGGFGIEPVVYILAGDATAAVEIVREVC
ncbi:MAG: thiamine-phosphate synthase family protein [Natronomonas sp.]